MKYCTFLFWESNLGRITRFFYHHFTHCALPVIGAPSASGDVVANDVDNAVVVAGVGSDDENIKLLFGFGKFAR